MAHSYKSVSGADYEEIEETSFVPSGLPVIAAIAAKAGW